MVRGRWRRGRGRGLSSASPPADARRAATGLLARREHSAEELRAKLRAREFADHDIVTALDELRRSGLQSDRRFAENFTHARIQRGYGPVRIRHELRERGVPDDMVDEFVSVDPAAWRDQIAAVRSKRFGKLRPRDYAERARQARFLAYRGFTAEQIQAELKTSGE